VSSILLGVRDMDRSKRFYTEGLGWKIQRDYGGSVFFEPRGGSLVGFYDRDGLAANVGASPEGSGFSGLDLTDVVRSQARVDELLAEADQAGATILKPAAAQQWGGYGGVGSTNLFNRLNGTTRRAPAAETMIGRTRREQA
jgi:catechol 2,3-dioxygenase-like lactoylglutathione lyase family enzyme